MCVRLHNCIDIKDCIHKGIYETDARNFGIGIYDEDEKGFYGIRYKFGMRYIDTEYHWDTGAPHGTAQPLNFIGKYDGDLEEKYMFDYLEKLYEYLNYGKKITKSLNEK